MNEKNAPSELLPVQRQESATDARHETGNAARPLTGDEVDHRKRHHRNGADAREELNIGQSGCSRVGR